MPEWMQVFGEWSVNVISSNAGSGLLGALVGGALTAIVSFYVRKRDSADALERLVQSNDAALRRQEASNDAAAKRLFLKEQAEASLELHNRLRDYRSQFGPTAPSGFARMDWRDTHEAMLGSIHAAVTKLVMWSDRRTEVRDALTRVVDQIKNDPASLARPKRPNEWGILEDHPRKPQVDEVKNKMFDDVEIALVDFPHLGESAFLERVSEVENSLRSRYVAIMSGSDDASVE